MHYLELAKRLGLTGHALEKWKRTCEGAMPAIKRNDEDEKAAQKDRQQWLMRLRRAVSQALAGKYGEAEADLARRMLLLPNGTGKTDQESMEAFVRELKRMRAESGETEERKAITEEESTQQVDMEFPV